MSKSSNVVWHCTSYSNYERIKATRTLCAKKVERYSARKPLIWFSKCAQVDPVVKASIQGFDQLRPVVRLGTCVAKGVLPFNSACASAEITTDSRRRAVRKAEECGASTDDWFAIVTARMPLSAFIVEFYDRERDVWVSTRPDLTEFPADRDVVGKAKWAARLGLLCEREFREAAHRGDLGYAMQRYAEGYMAGDDAYWHWNICCDPVLPESMSEDDNFRQGFLDRVAHVVGGLLPPEPLVYDEAHENALRERLLGEGVLAAEQDCEETAG